MNKEEISTKKEKLLNLYISKCIKEMEPSKEWYKNLPPEKQIVLLSYDFDRWRRDALRIEKLSQKWTIRDLEEMLKEEGGVI